MKIKNIKDVDGFFKVIDSCAGKVELITGEGDRLNLKSKLCQYVSLTSLLKSDVEIPELEVVAYEPEDTERIIKFLMTNYNLTEADRKKAVSFFYYIGNYFPCNKNAPRGCHVLIFFSLQHAMTVAIHGMK